jgi:hypothetical protein
VNDATARLQRQLSFPPIARRIVAMAERCVDDANDDVVEARRRMARRLRRLARRHVERVRFMGDRYAFTWLAADCAADDLDNVEWQWVAWYWVGHVVPAGEAPPTTPVVSDTFRRLAAGLANAATLVVQSVRVGTNTEVLDRRAGVLEVELSRWRHAERAARAAEATP